MRKIEFGKSLIISALFMAAFSPTKQWLNRIEKEQQQFLHSPKESERISTISPSMPSEIWDKPTLPLRKPKFEIRSVVHTGMQAADHV